MPDPRQHPFHLRHLQGRVLRREVRASIEIAAPVDVVWNLLTDVAAYPTWNRFTPRIDTEALEVGNAVDLHVRLPRRRARVQREWVNLVDPPHVLCWGMLWGHTAVFVANRWQELEAIEGGTRYTTRDCFSGVLAPVVMATHGASMRDGFATCARDLRDAAERGLGNEGSP